MTLTRFVLSIIFFFILSQQLQAIKVVDDVELSIKSSLFENCQSLIISNPQHVIKDSTKIHVIKFHVDQYELDSYREIPSTYTRVNKKLADGVVKGVPTADDWAGRTTSSWQLPPDHPRNNKTNCVKVARMTAATPLRLYDQLHVSSQFYLVIAKNALIHDSGIVGLSCGYFQAVDGCETYFRFIGRRWWNQCKTKLQKNGILWNNIWKNESLIGFRQCFEKGKNLLNEDRVFIITAQWDNNYHHFLIDALSRLIRSIGFLQKNPDIKIHIRKFEQFAKKERYIEGGRQMRLRLIKMLGLNASRFINGPVVAKTIYFPKAVKCNNYLGSALEIRKLASFIIKKSSSSWGGLQNNQTLQNYSSKHFNLSAVFQRPKNRKPIIIIQQRFCEGLSCLKTWRDWDDDFQMKLVEHFSITFPFHEIVTISSNNEQLTNCLECQIELYTKAEILVGLHGAGLTNVLFMPPNSILFEISGQFDGRMMPLCGYHGGLGSIFGVHHFVFYYDWKGGEKLDPLLVTHTARDFFKILRSSPPSSLLRVE